jgi:hypothetical protein
VDPAAAGVRLHLRQADAGELAAKGLYLDLPPWGVNAFAVEPTAVKV